MITNLKVLNALQDNAADFFVDAYGFLNVTGLPKIKCASASTVITPAVAAVAGVRTITFTAQQGYTYFYSVTGYTRVTNKDGVVEAKIQTIPFTYTTPTIGATATTIATAIAANINNSVFGATMTATGGATLVLTGTTTYPLISFTNTQADPNIVISAFGAGSTLGVAAVGLGSALLADYTVSQFADSSNISPTANYTQVLVTCNPAIMTSGDVRTETGIETYLVLVNEAGTSSGLNTFAFNFALLLAADDFGVTKAIGTVTGLQLGRRVVVQSPATTTAAITVTTGAIALSGGSATLTTLQARQGDVLVISASGGTAFTTSVRTTLIGITSATAATGDNVTAASAAVFKTIGMRNIPF